jgi:hypothetical protein
MPGAFPHGQISVPGHEQHPCVWCHNVHTPPESQDFQVEASFYARPRLLRERKELGPVVFLKVEPPMRVDPRRLGGVGVWGRAMATSRSPRDSTIVSIPCTTTPAACSAACAVGHAVITTPSSDASPIWPVHSPYRLPPPFWTASAPIVMSCCVTCGHVRGLIRITRYS